MPETLKLAIGDISLAIEWQGHHGKWDIPPAYQPFIAAGKPDVRLVLHKGLPGIASGKKIFDSAPIWSLFRYQGKSALKIFENFEGLQRTLILPPRLDQAELFFNASGSRFMDPFFGPTLELLMINYLARGNGAIIHGCGIDCDGTGILFAGESGAGKSTLANLWNRVDGADVLSDDRTLVRQINGELRMFGTPWHGEAKFGAARGVRLQKIFFLHHGQKNEAQPLTVSGSVQKLLQCSFPPYWDAAGMQYTMGFFEKMATRISCDELAFRPDESVIEMIKRQADTHTGTKQ
jgi:hypothetical protein